MIKKILKRVLGVLVLLLIVFVIVVATRPGEYQVTRSGKIAAPPAVVFAQVNDFNKWEAWSPWAKIDPQMKKTIEGPAGVGATYHWVGNKDVGEGRMTIAESQTNDFVRIKLEFIKPFESVCATEIAFKGEGNDTTVTWSMSGTNGFVAKAFCMFMDMDKMIGADFEKGIAQMRTVSE